MKKTEIILALLCVIAIILNITLVPGGIFLTLLSLMFLSMLYFGFSFLLLNQIRLRNIFKMESYQGVSAIQIIGAIGAGFTLSMLLGGMMFKLLRWPGSSVQLIASLFMAMIIVITCSIRYFMNRSAYCKRILLRTVSIGTIALILFMIPGASITRFKYRNYPAYLEAFEKHQQNPDDVELLRHMDEERRKMEEGN